MVAIPDPDPDYQEPTYSCKPCKDRGFILKDGGKGSIGVATPCTCRLNARKSRLLAASGITERWQGVRVTDKPPGAYSASQSAAKAKAHQWARQQHKKPSPRGLFFWGDPGRGKSFLLYGALMTLWEHAPAGRAILYTTQAEVLDRSYDRWSDEADRRRGLEESLAAYRKAEILALDEIGEDRPTEHTASILRGILETRDRQGLPVLAASNHSPDLLKNRIGGAAASRLLGLCEAVQVQGRDLRGG